MVRRAHEDCVRTVSVECCCQISHEMDQINQLFHIHILSQAPYPDSSLTVTPSWLNFAPSNPSTSSKTVLPASTLTSPKFSFLTSLPCSLHWLLTLKSKILMLKELPQTADQVSLPLQRCMGSICGCWLPAHPALPQPGHRPRLKCPPSWFLNVGLSFPPTSGHNSLSLTSFVHLKLVPLFCTITFL